MESFGKSWKVIRACAHSPGQWVSLCFPSVPRSRMCFLTHGPSQLYVNTWRIFWGTWSHRWLTSREWVAHQERHTWNRTTCTTVSLLWGKKKCSKVSEEKQTSVVPMAHVSIFLYRHRGMRRRRKKTTRQMRRCSPAQMPLSQMAKKRVNNKKATYIVYWELGTVLRAC